MTCICGPLQGGMRRTALHWACLQGHVRVVEQLIAHGADTKARRAPHCTHTSALHSTTFAWLGSACVNLDPPSRCCHVSFTAARPLTRLPACIRFQSGRPKRHVWVLEWSCTG